AAESPELNQPAAAVPDVSAVPAVADAAAEDRPALQGTPVTLTVSAPRRAPAAAAVVEPAPLLTHDQPAAVEHVESGSSAEAAPSTSRFPLRTRGGRLAAAAAIAIVAVGSWFANASRPSRATMDAGGANEA